MHRFRECIPPGVDTKLSPTDSLNHVGCPRAPDNTTPYENERGIQEYLESEPWIGHCAAGHPANSATLRAAWRCWRRIPTQYAPRCIRDRYGVCAPESSGCSNFMV